MGWGKDLGVHHTIPEPQRPARACLVIDPVDVISGAFSIEVDSFQLRLVLFN